MTKKALARLIWAYVCLEMRRPDCGGLRAGMAKTLARLCLDLQRQERCAGQAVPGLAAS